MIEFDLINILISVVATINLGAGYFIYNQNKNSSINVVFFVFTLAITLWCLAMIIFRGTSNIEVLHYSAYILYFVPPFIPFIFLYFTFVFPKKTIVFNLPTKLLITLPLFLISFLVFFPGFLISEIVYLPGNENPIYFNIFGYFIYSFFISLYWGLSYIRLFKNYSKIKDKIIRKQIFIISIGVIISTLIAVATNLILPLYNVFSFNWLGQIGTIVMISSIFYSIQKYRLFNIKVVATKIFVFALWIFIFTRTLLSDSLNDQLINGSLLVLTIIVGLFLIKSVMNEVKQREEIEKLAGDLEKANRELKKSDLLKSEFVSIASHQLRSPLTAIKGYASMVLEGSYGKISKDAGDALTKIYHSTENLVSIVQDFLDVSRIEQGSMQYDFEKFDFKDLVQNVVDELMPNVKNSGLKISFNFDEKENFMIYGDKNKIRQVILNLVDNAVKYTPKGGIKVQLVKKIYNNRMLLTVVDSGVGMDPDLPKKLFNKFERAEDADKTNVSGTGLGLYIAKKIIEAHQGSIWAESEGKGKGSKFNLELNCLE